jgi:hypothetical protein
LLEKVNNRISSIVLGLRERLQDEMVLASFQTRKATLNPLPIKPE